MKGVLLSVDPAARLLDLTHEIPPQDVRYASYFLAAALPYFPPQTLHVTVVDPGVGSERAILYAEVAGQRMLAPDNGCLTALFAERGPPTNVRRVRASRYFRPEISATFHGRDIFAPVAGHLSLGLDPAKLGPSVGDWVRLETPAPQQTKDEIRGEVVFVDHFGNLITNIPADMVRDRPQLVRIGRRMIRRFTWVRTYAEVQPGEVALLVASDGKIELAIAQGNAARRLRAGPGTPLVVLFRSLV
jgi:S-adenosylmethionine hydrolase